MNRDISKQTAETIFREYSDYVFRVALFLTKSKVMADDITQETFLQIFGKYHTYDTAKPMKPWVYKITLNITRNMLRKHKWLGFFGEVPETVDLSGCVESTVVRSEEEQQLWSAINSLSIKNREIIVFHFYTGMTLKEISEVLGIPLGTCKSRLNSALNSMRKQVSQSDFVILGKGGDLIDTI